MLNIVVVVRGGGTLSTLDLFLFKGCRGVELRRVRRERLWARVRERLSVARRAAVTSGDGGSPKMKNFIKAPRRITIESWPRRRPWVKERLRGGELVPPQMKEDLRGLGFWRRRFYAGHTRNCASIRLTAFVSMKNTVQEISRTT